MLTLFLDTASAKNRLALCEDDVLLAHIALGERKDSEIVPAIEKVLQDHAKEYADLTHLACTVGPGGFTNLRIGITTMNTLAYTLDLPITGIHLAALWASRVFPVGARHAVPLHPTTREAPFLWLHSTRRTQLFVKGYAADGSTTPCTLLELEEAVALQGEYVGELIDEHKEILENCVPMPEEKLKGMEEFLPGFLKDLKYAKQKLVPWYGREA